MHEAHDETGNAARYDHKYPSRKDDHPVIKELQTEGEIVHDVFTIRHEGPQHSVLLAIQARK